LQASEKGLRKTFRKCGAVNDAMNLDNFEVWCATVLGVGLTEQAFVDGMKELLKLAETIYQDQDTSAGGGAPLVEGSAPISAPPLGYTRESRTMSMSTLTLDELETMHRLSDEDIYELYEELYDEAGAGRQIPEPSSITATARREAVETEARKVIASKSPMNSPALKPQRDPEVPLAGDSTTGSKGEGGKGEAGAGSVHVPWYQIKTKQELMQVEGLSNDDILELYTELHRERGIAEGFPPPSEIDTAKRRVKVQEEAARQLQLGDGT